MKNLFLISCLLFFAFGSAQDSLNTNEKQKMDSKMELNADHSPKGDVASFQKDSQEYIFSPEETGFFISTDQDGKEEIYGQLIKTTDDGFYILTTNGAEGNVSYGRFDEQGNFKAMRYDPDSDTVLEEKLTRSN